MKISIQTTNGFSVEIIYTHGNYCDSILKIKLTLQVSFKIKIQKKHYVETYEGKGVGIMFCVCIAIYVYVETICYFSFSEIGVILNLTQIGSNVFKLIDYVS